ncbi:MAG: hypothetical protein K2W96_28670, partial [Gemmataceae bacterium]|nr:hypothetical protein [Gemmataceae bacterium]
MSRMALVADDQRLGSAIRAELRRRLGRDIPCCGPDEARAHLDADLGGFLLLAAGSPADADRVLRLVQEV